MIITYFNNLKNIKRKISHLFKHFLIPISPRFFVPGLLQVIKKKKAPKKCGKVHCKCLESERKQFCDMYVSNALRNLVYSHLFLYLVSTVLGTLWEASFKVHDE